MPLYLYSCDDCGAELEILHERANVPATCGLDCQLRGSGSFGKGSVTPRVSAANLGPSPPHEGSSSTFADMRREALRQKGLRRLGGEVTEQDLNRLRDKGIAVYRRDGRQSWSRDGGPAEAPPQIALPEDDG